MTTVISDASKIHGLIPPEYTAWRINVSATARPMLSEYERTMLTH